MHFEITVRTFDEIDSISWFANSTFTRRAVFCLFFFVFFHRFDRNFRYHVSTPRKNLIRKWKEIFHLKYFHLIELRTYFKLAEFRLFIDNEAIAEIASFSSHNWASTALKATVWANFLSTGQCESWKKSLKVSIWSMTFWYSFLRNIYLYSDSFLKRVYGILARMSSQFFFTNRWRTAVQ